MACNEYKLSYFDARGIAETARLLFAAAGQKYEDHRFARESWEAIKPTTPFGQAPVLEVNGQKFAQSVAINTYLAREFGLYGKCNLDGLKIDQVVQLGVDFMNSARKYFYEQDEAKKAELLKNFTEVEVPKFLGLFEKLLKESGTGYFVGNSLTLADICIYDLIYNLKMRKMVAIENYPSIVALVNKVESNDKIKAYLATRKETEN